MVLNICFQDCDPYIISLVTQSLTQYLLYAPPSLVFTHSLSHAVSTLVAHLPSRQASLSSLAFERVLIACADSLQLKVAFETFQCMTHTHRLAPTRAGLRGLGRLLCSPVLTADPQWRQFRLAFASRILEGGVCIIMRCGMLTWCM